MRAEKILQQLMGPIAIKLDPRWIKSIWGAVDALLQGQVLQLSRLGRCSRRDAAPKHRIKAMDRLLGSFAVQAIVTQAYTALSRLALAQMRSSVVLVDWTQIREKTYEIKAAIPFGGRAVPILSLVFRNARQPTRRMHRKFLDELQHVLPTNCTPILVTDAGFQATWIQDIERKKWQYVARIRHLTCVRPLGEYRWRRNKRLHTRARRKAKDLGFWELVKDVPKNRITARLVLAKRHRCHRHPKGSSGKVLTGGNTRRLKARYGEPWLLATNLTKNAAVVIAAYKKRMQIEETFRDAKSTQFGFGLRHSRITDPGRLSVLILIGTLGFYALFIVGTAAIKHRLHRQLQANTSTEPVLSVFQVGLLICTTKVRHHLRFRHFEAVAANMPTAAWAP